MIASTHGVCLPFGVATQANHADRNYACHGQSDAPSASGLRPFGHYAVEAWRLRVRRRRLKLRPERGRRQYRGDESQQLGVSGMLERHV